MSLPRLVLIFAKCIHNYTDEDEYKHAKTMLIKYQNTLNWGKGDM